MVQLRSCLVDREFTLFSTEYEQSEFYLLERDPNVKDIRENLPIFDIDFTLERCARYGLRHSYRDGYPDPFTIDFIITELINGVLQDRALSVKTPDDANDPEVRQRLKVERVWCRDRAGIPWSLVDTSKFSKDLLSTLLFMRAWFQLDYEPDPDREAMFLDYFLRKYTRNTPLRELILRSARALRMTEDMATDTFRYCAWRDRIPVSLRHHLSLHLPLVLRSSDKNDD